MSLEVEQTLRAAHDAGDLELTLTQTVEHYGPEVLGFLVSRLRDHDAANEAFAQTCETLCTSIHSFQWRCSMRTWIYKLARSAVSRHLRSPANRNASNIPLSQVSDVADRLRTQTREYLRTEIKDRFAALRQELDADDQTLLILRVDRGLDWREVAVVLSDDALDDEEHKRVAARLRQRFTTVKKQLRQRAIDSGLISDAG